MTTNRPTDRHHRPARLAVCVIVGLCAAIALGPDLAGAHTALPSLDGKLNAKGTAVTLRWEYSSSARQRDRVIVVERAEQGGPFVEVLRRAGAGLKASWTDKNLPSKPLRYRVQLLVNGTGSGWSPVVSVPGAGDRATTATTPSTSPPSTPPPTTSPPATSPPGATLCPESWDATVIAAVNKARQAAGAPPVTSHPKLATAANNRGITMARSQTMSHTGWVEEVNRSGYNWNALAENIHAAVGVSQVTPDWMASAGHRQNIVNRTYDDVGVGCAFDSRGVPYWALLLGQGN